MRSKKKDTIEFVDTKSKVTVLSVYRFRNDFAVKEMFEWMESSRNVELLLKQTVDLYGPIWKKWVRSDDFVDNFMRGLVWPWKTLMNSLIYWKKMR